MAPYLDHLKATELNALAEICNKNVWFDTRRRLLDPRIDNRRAAWPPIDTANAFDRLVQHPHLFGIDLELDHALKTGVRWPELRDQIDAWYRSRNDLLGLEAFAQALQHLGARTDLAQLAIPPEVDSEMAAAIIGNTTFTVRRCSAR